MFSNFEEKGKIFTQVITKKPVDVILQTPTNRISGKIHIRPDDRLKDELDRSEGFIAVTEAVIMDSAGVEVVARTRFLAVLISQIIWVSPVDDLEETGE